MTRPERFRFFLDYFTANFPAPETELLYRNPYELIVAVVLSAQCTDKRVNLVMPALLAAFPTPRRPRRRGGRRGFSLHPQRFVSQ